MKRIFFTLCLCCLAMTTMAQRQLKLFTNSQAIDPERYKDVQGDPMMFKNWQKGYIIDNRDSLYTDITLNYNGFEEEFELQRNSRTYIALNNKYYKQIAINSEEGIDGKLIFEKTGDARFKGKFLQVINKSDKITVYKYFEARKAEVTVQDVGKTRTFENFKKVSSYYRLVDGKLRLLRVKKKSLLAELGQKKALESFIKKNRLKLNSDKDLQRLFRYYDSL